MILSPIVFSAWCTYGGCDFRCCRWSTAYFCPRPHHSAVDSAAGGLFEDAEFPPIAKSLRGNFSEFLAQRNTDRIQIDHTHRSEALIDQVKWVRSTDILSRRSDDRKPTAFGYGVLNSEDVKQGKLGDCYLMASLSCAGHTILSRTGQNMKRTLHVNPSVNPQHV